MFTVQAAWLIAVKNLVRKSVFRVWFMIYPATNEAVADPMSATRISVPHSDVR